MSKTTLAVFVATCSAALVSSAALAAPVTYSFSASGQVAGGPTVVGAPFVDPSLFSAASGTFVYDNAAGVGSTGADGMVNYRGFGTAFVTSLSNLSGVAGTRTFADVAGVMNVSNDNFAFNGGTVDRLQLLFEPFSPTDPRPHNLSSSGFSSNGLSLVNVRMFWLETQETPELIGDFLSDSSLPATLPGFHGRLAFDFAQPGETSPSAFVFIDGLTVAPLAVPEPETDLLLAAGLGMLVFRARRRKGAKAR